jgi:RHS repeat-associated protein
MASLRRGESLKHRYTRGPAFRATARLLVAGQVLLAVPPPANAQEPAPEAEQRKEAVAPPAPAPPPQAQAVTPNRTAPTPAPDLPYPTFSTPPTTAEITRARVFGEPLVPLGGEPTAQENQALATALSSYLRGQRRDALSGLVGFLGQHPTSPWRASLLLNLGLTYRRTAYYSRALAAWEQAWTLAKDGTDAASVAVADRAIGELAELNARLGRADVLESLLGQIAGRDIKGAAASKLDSARNGLAMMRHHPEEAFLCGPLALDRIMAARPGYRPHPAITSATSTARGTSLLQMRDLGRTAGMRTQMAFRTPQASIIAPAMVHWRTGHFAAIVGQARDRYQVQDPTFGDEVWATREAVDDEGSGYFLVPEGPLPAGWRSVGEEEAAGVWGKGFAEGSNAEELTQANVTKGGEPCEPCIGMAAYTFMAMLVSLRISDSPVGYAPPRGPGVQFTATYNQRESFQPSIFTYSNLGPMWTFHWMSYIEDDPSNPGGTVTVYARGGGRETFMATGSLDYAPHFTSHATLHAQMAPSVRYERRLPNGSVEVFARADGAASFPRRIFMTEWRDPQGNAVTFTYDTSLRLVAATDAIGQVTTVHYEHADPLKITKVTDPFGRFARFEYNSAGRLSRITDVIGLVSEFTYGAGDFIDSMTTPYGTTRFTTGGSTGGGGTSAFTRWLQATDPLGGTERITYENLSPVFPVTEVPALVPQGFDPNWNQHVNRSVTSYWDKRAMALHPGDYTKAYSIAWNWIPVTKINSGNVKWEKAPLENRVWYAYPGQPAGYWTGTGSQPVRVGRVLDDGSSQTYQYEYNAKGKVTKATNPLGRETVYVYGTGSTPDPDPANGTGIDLLQVKQKTGPTTFDLVSNATYNARHRVLTSTDAAGQSTTYTYLADGRLQTVVTPLRNGPGGPLTLAERTTTSSYYADNAPTGAGRLQTVTGPSTPQGSPVTSYTYDVYGRIQTATDPDNYALTFAYDTLDRPTRTAYPDGTYEETAYNRLDAEKTRDRRGRWSHTFHDALRRLVSTRDPLGRTTTQQWCTCGSLDKLIDANGNATTWERDLQGRTTREVRADTQAWEYTYENTTSRLKERKDPKLQVTGYEYFLDDNLKQVTYSGAVVPTPNVSFTYDPNHSRVATMTDGTGTTNYGYHAIGVPPALGAGRLAAVDGPLANDTVSYAYDELGDVASRGLSGFTSTFVRDSLGRLVTQGSPMGNFTSTYDGRTSRPLSLSYPNGQATQYTYFPTSGDHRLQEIKHLAPGSSILSKHNYTYDANSNVRTWRQQAGAGAAKLYELGYDAADQLASATLETTDPTPVILKRYGYAYESVGNRTSEQVDHAVFSATHNNRNQVTSRQAGGTLLFRGTVNEPAAVSVQGQSAQVAPANSFEGTASVPSGTSTVTVVAQDYAQPPNVRTNTYQLTVTGAGTTYTYDLNGNLTGDGTKTFEWDAEDRLTAVKQGATVLASFAYDGQGRRVHKTAGGVTHTYVYDGEDIVEERLSGGQTLRYVHGSGIDRPLAQRDGAGVVSYYLADHLGSIVLITNSSGATTLTREYDPWGNQLQGSASSGYAFTGREWDSETGLHYYRARYYDPKLGRFLSEDPIGLGGGLNLFVYVLNRPVNWIDPFGLQGVKCDGCSKLQEAYVTGAVASFCELAQKPKCKMGLKQLGLDKCAEEKCREGLKVACVDQINFNNYACGTLNYPWNNVVVLSRGAFPLLPGQPNNCNVSVTFVLAHEIAHLCGIGCDYESLRCSKEEAELNLNAANNVGMVCSEP